MCDMIMMANAQPNHGTAVDPTAGCKFCSARSGTSCHIHRNARRPRPSYRPAGRTAEEPGICSDGLDRLLDDEISTIGTWYLSDSLPSRPTGSGRSRESAGPRGSMHAYWGVAIWQEALQDPLLFRCLALLTLHKRRALVGAWDPVQYFKHKQEAYRLLRAQVLQGSVEASAAAAPSWSLPSPSSSSAAVGASFSSNTTPISTAPLVLTVSLISFAEVLEGRFPEAALHVRRIAALHNLAATLSDTQWALVAWSDLRFAMKTANNPVLSAASIPAAYLAQAHAAGVDATYFGADARHRALHNWKLAQPLFTTPPKQHGAGPAPITALYEILRGVHGLSPLLSDPHIPLAAKLAKMYPVEHALHTLVAATTAADDAAPPLLFLAALQLHVLALVSTHVPSTPECREFVLARARTAAQRVLRRLDDEEKEAAERSRRRRSSSNSSRNELRPTATPLIWALVVLATHRRRYGTTRTTSNPASTTEEDDPFLPLLARLTAAKDLRCRSAFRKLLQSWPTIAPWYPTQAAALWGQVLRLRGQRWILQVGGSGGGGLEEDDDHVEEEQGGWSQRQKQPQQQLQPWFSGYLMFYG